VLEQCNAEQNYVRGAMARSAMYLQVSVSGQALVFVVRTVNHSLLSRAGGLTYVAFLVAQVRVFSAGLHTFSQLVLHIWMWLKQNKRCCVDLPETKAPCLVHLQCFHH
jgi:hypothetical protein